MDPSLGKCSAKSSLARLAKPAGPDGCQVHPLLLLWQLATPSGPGHLTKCSMPKRRSCQSHGQGFCALKAFESLEKEGVIDKCPRYQIITRGRMVETLVSF